MKALEKITKRVSGEKEVYSNAVELSLSKGGAWVVWPNLLNDDNTCDVDYFMFRSPCCVPDFFSDVTRNRIVYKGKIIPFTRAAQIREQNRGLGCE